MVEGQATKQGGQDHLLAHAGDLTVDQHFLVVVDVVAGDTDGAEGGGGEAPHQVDVGPVVALGIGGGVVAIGGDARLQGVERPREVGERQAEVEAPEDGAELAIQGHRVGPAEQVVERQHRIGGDAFAGCVAAAERQAGPRPVGQADDHRTQAVGVRGRGQGDVDGVVDAGVKQPPLELGHRLGIVDLTRPPGRQGGHPAWIGAAQRLQLQPVEPDLGLRIDLVGRPNGLVGVVDHHLPLARRGVGVAILLQGGDDAALGGDDVGRPARSAKLQRQGLGGVGLGRRVGGGPAPGDLGCGDQEARPRIDLDHRLGLVAGADVGGDGVVVIAF